MTPSLYYFPVNTGVRQGCVLAPALFNTCIDHVQGTMSERRSGQSGSLIITSRKTRFYSRREPNFPGALESLSEDAEPIALLVFWIKRSLTSWMRPVSQFL